MNIPIPPIMTFTFTEVRFLHDGPRVGFLSLPTGKRNSSATEHTYSHIPKSTGIRVWCRNIKNIMPKSSIIVQTTHSEPPTRQCYAYQFELPSMKTYYDVTRGHLYLYENQGCGVDEFPGDSDSDPPESTPTLRSRLRLWLRLLPCIG